MKLGNILAVLIALGAIGFGVFFLLKKKSGGLVNNTTTVAQANVKTSPTGQTSGGKTNVFDVFNTAIENTDSIIGALSKAGVIGEDPKAAVKQDAESAISNLGN